jgi:flagellar protein FlaF
MYHRTYMQAAEDSHVSGRRRERELLERAVKKLAVAKRRGPGSVGSFEATGFLRQLWGAFMLDLASDENLLSPQLRASLISIGVWVHREADLIDRGNSQNFDGLIEINQIIADGLI